MIVVALFALFAICTAVVDTSTHRTMCELPSFLTNAEAAEYYSVFTAYITARKPPRREDLAPNDVVPYDCYADYYALQRLHVETNTKACQPYTLLFPQGERFKIEYEFVGNLCRIIAKRADETASCDPESVRAALNQ
jgi:hypothetical protein